MSMDAIRRALDALPDSEPLPALPRVAYPKTVRGHGVPVGDLLDGGTVDTHIRDLQARIVAEAARIRRLLPPPPWGYEWQWELSADDEWTEPFRIDTVYRVRYRLVEIPLGQRTYG